MPGRTFSAESYRYGFNGQEKSDEIDGAGNSYTAEFWQYDPRLGRRWNVDPICNSFESRYTVFRDNPNYFIDPDGLFSQKWKAWIWAKVHKGNNEVHYDKGKKEWYVANVTKQYSVEGINVIVNSKTYSWNVKFIAVGEASLSVGAQAEVKWETPKAFKTQVKGKIGGGAGVFDLGKLKVGYDGEKMIFEPKKSAQVIHNYVMVEAGGDLFGMNVGGGLKYDYNFAYYNGYYGPQMEGDANDDFAGYIFGRSFNKGAKRYDQILNPFSNPLRPKFKTGIKTEAETRFFGTEFGGSIKLLLGVDYKLRVGIDF